MALSQRERRLLLIPVALGAIFAFYNWVHVPLHGRKAEAADQMDKVSAELRRGEGRLVKEGNLRVRMEAVSAREKVIDAWVPGKNSAALFIWYLSQAEMQSGARIQGIKFSEKKQVAAAQKQPGAPTPVNQTGSAPAPGTTQAGSPQVITSLPGTQAPNATEGPLLTVVQLEIKTDARFAQHLQFNQALEEMPLFLSTSAFTMAKAAPAPIEEAGKLVEGGNNWLAAQLLGASPAVSGSYKVDLYFKTDKVGPSADTMYFSEDAGRIDPFALDVDEFLATIVRYYSGQPGPGGNRGPLPALPEDLKGQLG